VPRLSRLETCLPTSKRRMRFIRVRKCIILLFVRIRAGDRCRVGVAVLADAAFLCTKPLSGHQHRLAPSPKQNHVYEGHSCDDNSCVLLECRLQAPSHIAPDSNFTVCSPPEATTAPWPPPAAPGEPARMSCVHQQAVHPGLVSVLMHPLSNLGARRTLITIRGV